MQLYTGVRLYVKFLRLEFYKFINHLPVTILYCMSVKPYKTKYWLKYYLVKHGKANHQKLLLANISYTVVKATG